MINYEHFVLENGLKVYVHEDHSAPIAVLNLLYDVGAKDEESHKTGFAHLFEHLMFGGSKNIPSFDEPLQRVGGENNAFTSNDITNYYISVPSNNLETAFWLESDRMLSLSFDPKVLEVQRSVVIEEFKQRYLNQPYGDAWLKLRPLAYQVHPYQWPTIGKEIAHIENATMDDVQSFFYKFYIPNNAYLVIAGDVTISQVKRLCDKWFTPIPSGKPYYRDLPQEPTQISSRITEVSSSVPLNALYKVFHSPAKTDKNYFASDLFSDILGRGKSSFLYQKLVKERSIFSSISAHLSGTYDSGLLIIDGKLNKGISCEEGDKILNDILGEFSQNTLLDSDLEKVKHQAESSHVFGNIELLNRAMNLAFAAGLGDAAMVNKEIDLINNVSMENIKNIKQQILDPNNSSTLLYKAKSI
ncbi:MAG: insulinase family protein [Cytophagales bacterium]|nr:MAG: insulinase family protein [Cytophagales bacterium]